MLTFVGGVHFKNGVEVAPHWKKINIHAITNMPTITRELPINNEMTTPNRCHDMTILVET